MGWKTRKEGSAAQVGSKYQDKQSGSVLGARAGAGGVAQAPQPRSVDSMKSPIRTVKQDPNFSNWTKAQQAGALRTEARQQYLDFKINQKTFNAKMRAADKVAAPSRAEVIENMRQREIAQGKPADENQRYNGWSNHDTWNTMLLMDNTERSSRWLDDWSKNFNRKIKAGTFDAEKAESVVDKYIVPAARGSSRFKWAVGEDFTPDPDIDPKKVNKAEIVRQIIEREDESQADVHLEKKPKSVTVAAPRDVKVNVKRKKNNPIVFSIGREKGLSLSYERSKKASEVEHPGDAARDPLFRRKAKWSSRSRKSKLN